LHPEKCGTNLGNPSIIEAGLQGGQTEGSIRKRSNEGATASGRLERRSVKWPRLSGKATLRLA
jgi:hypothetical protein